jgi:N-acetylmuramoyl-L-alanine amidase
MRWIRGGWTVLLLLPALSHAQEKHITIYSPQTSYTLSVLDRGGQDYVGLLEILEPLGNVRAATQGRTWRLRFNEHDSEFTDGSPHARVPDNEVDMPSTFRLENNRGLVPLSGIAALLTEIVGTKKIIFHEGARRLFLGNVTMRYTAELNRGNPSRLILNFTSAVSPRIATEPGRLHMSFLREPLVAGSALAQTFDDRTISSMNFAEGNGTAELTVYGSVPLFASFSNDGRTITLSAAPQGTQATPPPPQQQPAPAVPAVQTQPASPTPSGPTPVTPSTQAPSPVPPTTQVRVFAVVDASHGGTERGEALSPTLAEKDLNLAFARALANALQAKGVAALVLRDSDATLTLDQRAALTNGAHAAVYVAVHTSSQGRGVRVFHSLLPAGESRGTFQSWDQAQASALAMSQPTASSVASELRKHSVPALTLAAPLRPLNNLRIPAIAIEVAPNSSDVNDLNSADYQQSIAADVADGILALRDRLEAAR